MSNIRIKVLAVVLASISTGVSAQQFRSERLRQAAVATGCPAVDLPKSAAQTMTLVARDGLTLCVRTDSASVIEHIGIPLFADDMRTFFPSPIYDFLEYATLAWHYKVSPNLLYLQRVVFEKGNWHTLATDSLSSAECTISNHEDKEYSVTWQRLGTEIASVRIPIDYELLSNDTRRHLEQTLVAQMEALPQTVARPTPHYISDEELNIYGTTGLLVKSGASYMMAELNQNVYYELKTVSEQTDTVIHGKKETIFVEDVMPQIVLNNEHPYESMANLMMAPTGFVPDVLMTVCIHLSNFHKRSLTIPMSQLSRFLRAEGCELFFAVTTIQDEQASGVLFAVNKARGYNHLFTVNIPRQQIVSTAPTATADAYLYIPAIDKDHLFSKLPVRKSGVKIGKQ